MMHSRLAGPRQSGFSAYGVTDDVAMNQHRPLERRRPTPVYAAGGGGVIVTDFHFLGTPICLPSTEFGDTAAGGL